MFNNKRGQDLSIGTLILIILGVIVLVLLILGFSMGWGNLWSKINIFGSTNDVSSVVTACKLAVTSNSNYDYCQNFKKVKVNDETMYVNCDYDVVKEGLAGQTLNCAADTKEKFCATLKEDDKAKIKVNGVLCPVNQESSNPQGLDGEANPNGQ